MSTEFTLDHEEFQTYEVGFEGRVKMWKIRKAFDDLLNLVYEQTEVSPWNMMKKTQDHLEIACFYAIKQIAANPINHPDYKPKP